MKKIFKFVSIVCTLLVIAFVVYCFIPEDDYDYDYSDDYSYDDNQYSTSNPSSSQVDREYDFEAFSAAKDELISQGLVRSPLVELKGNGEDQVTILVYMNGSDLESDYSEATTDLSEMVAAGSSDKVNLVVQTMGTKKWNSKFGISSKRSERYEVNGNGLTLVDDSLGQLDCTRSETLSDFIKWGVSKYPADRYILLFWNHGGGPIYGFGYDEWNSDEYACLSVDEMKTAFKEAGVVFDFIGLDCCIMSCLETGCAIYDYCDYFITSEDFESGLGWSYTPWLKALYNNTSISTPELGKIICDSMVQANENDRQNGDDSIMAVIDTSMVKILYTTWVDFAYANKDTLLGTNYSEKIFKKRGGRVLPSIANRSFWFDDEEDTSLSDYYITDIMAVAQNIESDESRALSAAISESLVYVRASSGDASLTGISVTLPYSDTEFYDSLHSVFTNIGLDTDYINWLEEFTYVSNNTQSYDYNNWYDEWDGWDDYDDEYDWSDWDYYDDDDYDDNYYWDDFDYSDSFNYWYDMFLDFFDDDGYYEGDDYYYGDDWYDDCWYY